MSEMHHSDEEDAESETESTCRLPLAQYSVRTITEGGATQAPTKVFTLSCLRSFICRESKTQIMIWVSFEQIFRLMQTSFISFFMLREMSKFLLLNLFIATT